MQKVITGKKSVDECATFESLLTGRERSRIDRISSPHGIQELLDSLAYSTDACYRSPLRSIRDGRAHCYDGAVLGAALLRRIGYPPLILNMFANGRDDEHLIAPFLRRGAWGAVAQSNVVGLRYREPIHRSIRELIISYFEQYFNTASEKTLRKYTRPINLAQFDRQHWMSDDRAMDLIADRLEQLRRVPILSRGMIAGLARVDPLSYRAGMLGSVKKGLFHA